MAQVDKIFGLILCYLHFGHFMELRNITKNVFGDDLNYLPMAFGDFNSDKLTDLFAISDDRSKISILLAIEDSFSSVLTSHTYFKNPSQVDKNKLKVECTIDDATIESLVPGDFDGDGGMDIFILVNSTDTDQPKRIYGYVMW